MVGLILLHVASLLFVIGLWIFDACHVSGTGMMRAKDTLDSSTAVWKRRIHADLLVLLYFLSRMSREIGKTHVLI